MGEPRVPPNNLEAEQSVLGAMIMHRDGAAVGCELLKRRDFYHEIHGRIFGAVASLFERMEPVDLVTLSSELQARGEFEDIGGEYLTTIGGSCPTHHNARQYAEIVKACSQRRDLLAAASRVTELAFDEATETRDVLDASEAALYEVTQDRGGEDLVAVGEDAYGVLADIDNRRGGKSKRYHATGIGALDRMIHGLHCSELVTVGARPSIGKTAIVTNFALNIAKRGKRVVFFSLEMARPALVERMMCLEAHVDSDTVRAGYASDEQIAGPLGSACNTIAELPLWIDGSHSMSDMEIRAKARRHATRHGVDVIIVDYLHLMQSSRRAETENLELGAKALNMRRLAKELNVPVCMLSQLNKTAEGRRPHKGDLLGSGLIEAHSDMILLLHRDFEEGGDWVDCDVIVAKNRNGRTGDVALSMHKPYGLFVGREDQAYTGPRGVVGGDA